MGEVIGYENLQAGETYMYQAALNGGLDRVGASYDRSRHGRMSDSQSGAASGVDSQARGVNAFNDIPISTNYSLLMGRKPLTGQGRCRSPGRVGRINNSMIQS